MPGTPPFRVELLARHDCAAFSCGIEALDRYLKTQAGQDMRRHLATCFVAVHQQSQAVAGFYTLSASHVALEELAESKDFGRYEHVSAALLGRLAVDQHFQRQGLGQAMLYDAIRRILRSELAAAILIVDAKDDQAAAFYQRHGFLSFGTGHLKLYLPLKDAAKLFPKG